MAYVPYVGQVQHSALTRWIDLKAIKSFHCNDLPFSIFRNVLFHDASAVASTRGYVLPRSLLRPPFFFTSPTDKKRGHLLHQKTRQPREWHGFLATSTVLEAGHSP